MQSKSLHVRFLSALFVFFFGLLSSASAAELPVVDYSLILTQTPRVLTDIAVPTDIVLLREQPSYLFTRDLSIGSTGEDVRQLQKLLNNLGHTVAIDGAGSSGNETTYFGDATKHALTRFQDSRRAHILTPLGLTEGTGYFGQSTIDDIHGLILPQPTPPPPSNEFSIGDRIKVFTGDGHQLHLHLQSSNLNVRNSANGALLGQQNDGALGTVVGGPTNAGGFNWWNINFDSGADGWSVENGLELAHSVTPPPIHPPTPEPTPTPPPPPPPAPIHPPTPEPTPPPTPPPPPIHPPTPEPTPTPPPPPPPPPTPPPTPPPPTSNELSIGDRIEVFTGDGSNLNVRNTANGALLGQRSIRDYNRRSNFCTRTQLVDRKLRQRC